MSLEAEVKFAFEFLSLLNASEVSKVYSPVSLLHSLSMIYLGANNETAIQISNVIGKDNKSSGRENTKTTRKRLHLSDDHNDDELINIIIANKLFISSEVSALRTYQQIIKNEYNAEFEKLNFEDTVTSAKKINNFVCDATKGVIKEIVTSADLDSSMVAAIINAVYFQGFWEKPFENRRKRIFYSNLFRKIEMMTTSPKNGDWNFRVGNEWTALGIPYKNRITWMFIVLPEKKDGLSDLVAKMNFEFFKNVTTRQLSGKLGVTIPIIETTTELELPKYLSKLGIIDAFNDRCDLTNMFEGCKKHKIGKAIHKAVIKAR
uniref:Serpin domain-containing protein n=1 Tax=Panagrolaimus sp. ES5 TaxID=591445 RepID=A0AC34G5A8_9BILA